jgi:hypothetical protein
MDEHGPRNRGRPCSPSASASSRRRDRSRRRSRTESGTWQSRLPPPHRWEGWALDVPALCGVRHPLSRWVRDKPTGNRRCALLPCRQFSLRQTESTRRVPEAGKPRTSRWGFVGGVEVSREKVVEVRKWFRFDSRYTRHAGARELSLRFAKPRDSASCLERLTGLPGRRALAIVYVGNREWALSFFCEILQRGDERSQRCEREGGRFSNSCCAKQVMCRSRFVAAANPSRRRLAPNKTLSPPPSMTAPAWPARCAFFRGVVNRNIPLGACNRQWSIVEVMGAGTFCCPRQARTLPEQWLACLGVYDSSDSGILQRAIAKTSHKI